MNGLRLTLGTTCVSLLGSAALAVLLAGCSGNARPEESPAPHRSEPDNPPASADGGPLPADLTLVPQSDQQPEPAIQPPQSTATNIAPKSPSGSSGYNYSKSYSPSQSMSRSPTSSWHQPPAIASRADMLDEASWPPVNSAPAHAESSAAAEHEYALGEATDVGQSADVLAEEALPGAAAAQAAPAAEHLNARDNELGNMVQVYFATDRRPTAELIPSPLRTFAPAVVVCMLGAALFIGFSLARRFHTLWLLGCGLAVCLSVMVLHASIVRQQQYTRLASNASTRFSTARDVASRDYPLHLGTASVSIPTIHQPGCFEQPSLYRFEFVETPKKHIVLHSLRVEPSSDAWFEALSTAASENDGQESFIFVHGYNVRFVDALKRTAQLSVDLSLRGPAICYSWPSRGDVGGYMADESSVAWSAPHFERLLLDLHTRTRCRHVNVIAHSMGNRAVLAALERIDLRMNAKFGNDAPRPKLVDSLVMAAPDVDLGEFANRYSVPLNKVARQTTLYFSDADRALQLSSGLHGGARLGLFAEHSLAEHPELARAVEWVYVGAKDLFSMVGLGHSYYGDDPAVLSDLKTVLRDNLPAAQRGTLRSASSEGGSTYWQIDRLRNAGRPAPQAMH